MEIAKNTKRKSKSLNQILRKNFTIIIIILNMFFAVILGFVVRKNRISNEKNNLKAQVLETSYRIYSKVNSDFEKINFLSDILRSQLNSNRIFYQYNSLFSQTLTSDESLNSIFIVFSKYAKINDPELFFLRDSVGRVNVSWHKNSKGVVNIDTLNTYANSQKYDIIKSIGDITVFNAKKSSENAVNSILKTITIPIFEGTNFIGIIGYTINSSYLNNILSTNDFKDYFFIADEDGILLYDRDKNINTGKPFTFLTNSNFRRFEQDIIHNTKLDNFSKREYLLLEPLNIDFLNLFWKIGVIVPSNKIILKANLYFILILLAFMVVSFIEIFIFNKIIIRSTFFLNEFIRKIHKLSIGEIDTEIHEVTNFMEINNLSQNLEYLRQRLLELTKIHSQIQQQYITVKLESRGKNDQLALSINQTIDTIKERAKSRKEAFDNKQKNEWISDGLSLIHEASKIGENSIEKLTDKINEKLSVYTDAFISTIFIEKVDEEENEKYLEAISTFGLKKKRAFRKRIKYGEGVVGTVASENKVQYFDKIPEDYHIIVGGLAEMRPKSILIQPLEYENEFLGVLEIAFLKRLKEYEIKFFRDASVEIALSIKNIINNISRNLLLEKMKNQTEEIAKAQKLLENKINELKIKEKESKENQAVLQAMLNAVNNTLMTIEYSTAGILITANQKYLKTMNYTLAEIKGVNVLDLVKSERAELNDVINRVSNGEYYEKIMKRFTKYGEVKWLYSTYTPYYDSNGVITKVLYFAIDVTNTKKYTEKLEKEISMFKKQIKILREKL